jgi:hypothetical protein
MAALLPVKSARACHVAQIRPRARPARNGDQSFIWQALLAIAFVSIAVVVAVRERPVSMRRPVALRPVSQ